MQRRFPAKSATETYQQLASVASSSPPVLQTTPLAQRWQHSQSKQTAHHSEGRARRTASPLSRVRDITSPPPMSRVSQVFPLLGSTRPVRNGLRAFSPRAAMKLFVASVGWGRRLQTTGAQATYKARGPTRRRLPHAEGLYRDLRESPGSVSYELHVGTRCVSSVLH